MIANMLLCWSYFFATAVMAASSAPAAAPSGKAGGGGGAGAGGGNSTSKPGAAQQSKTALEAKKADDENHDIQHWIGWIWVAFVGTFIVYQIIVHFVRYVRTVACLSNPSQRYFSVPHATFARFKKHLLDAPLFRTRHHREFKLSSAINIGTLPSRLQTLMLLGYFGTNVAYCVMSIDFHLDYKTASNELRNRTGVLAVMNMIPLFLLAGRNNPFILLCGISFDTFNLIHRWIGRIVVLEAVCHVAAWMANKIHSGGWASIGKAITVSNSLLFSGTLAISAFVFILFQSPSAIRHAFYETFLHLHILAAGTAVVAVLIHLKDPELHRYRNLVYGALAVWVFERTVRFARIMIRNVGAGGTKAEVEVLPGDALRLTVRMARPWAFRPGQHAYLYMPAIGLWTSHPFSLAWSEEEEDLTTMQSSIDEKGLPMNRQEILDMNKTNVSFIVRRRTGFTEKLYKKADLSAAGKFTTTCFVEGPYGGEDLASYGTVMLWAAGIGITHQVPHVRDIVARFDNGTTATRRLTLVWIIQSPEHLEWIRQYMTQILSMPRRREILKILLFVTRPRSTKEIHSPSSSVQMFPGKPNVQALIDQEMMEGVGAACVSVCGTGALADDLRRAVRSRESQWNVDFREESFSW